MAPRLKRPKRGKFCLPATLGDKFLAELLTVLPNESFKDHYLREELLSKFVDPTKTTPESRADAAVQKWLLSEKKNALTNERIIFDEDLGWTVTDDLFSHIRSFITHLIGEEPPVDLLRSGTHTNGSSTRIARGPLAALEKLVGDTHCSETALPHFNRFAEVTVMSQNLTNNTTAGAPLIAEVISQGVCLVNSSMMFTVPKKSDIDRVACKEPEINMLLQRQAGNFIRQRLRTRAGIDLNDQTINQTLASIAVEDGLATVDLKAASDSITRSLVIRCLPPLWWSLLDDLRVHSTILRDGTLHELEMFSSMGNGFTFELESLLFYAITSVVQKRSGFKGLISVYGDDIICNKHMVPRLKNVLHWLGFELNSKKTHSTGMFRESCGKHYYGRQDVSPFYIRRPIRTIQDLILHLNHILEWDGRGYFCFLHEGLASFHKRWSQSVPRILWGGVEVEDPTALVTGNAPRHRLIPVTVPLRRSASLKKDRLSTKSVDLPDALETAHYINTQMTITSRTEKKLSTVVPVNSTSVLPGEVNGDLILHLADERIRSDISTNMVEVQTQPGYSQKTKLFKTKPISRAFGDTLWTPYLLAEVPDLRSVVTSSEVVRLCCTR